MDFNLVRFVDCDAFTNILNKLVSTISSLMPEIELTKDPIGANRGKALSEQAGILAGKARKYYHSRYYTPPYRPTNANWEITFRALGWKRRTVEKFWKVFCRINTSLDGAIKLHEFLDFFNLDWTPLTERCFTYFDTTGGGDVDFLEFMISVWNVCTCRFDSLSNFAFDMYDLDSDGELSVPEVEHMVWEFFGKGGGGRCLEDATKYAEQRGGAMKLNAFISFTATHKYLMFPMFELQQILKKKILGMRYWAAVERSTKDSFGVKKDDFNPRHVQTLLRTYQTGGAAAVLSHTGDPNKGLLEWFENQKGQDGIEECEPVTDEMSNNSALKRWNMIRDKINGKAKTAKQWRNVKTNIFDRSLKKLVTLEKIKQFKTKRQSTILNKSIDDVRASAEMETSRDLEKDNIGTIEATNINSASAIDKNENMKNNGVKQGNLNKHNGGDTNTSTSRDLNIDRSRRIKEGTNSRKIRPRPKPGDVPNNVRQRQAGIMFHDR